VFDEPYAYNAANDELYELDYEALNFLKSCDGRFVEEDEVDRDFLNFLISEGLLVESDERREIEVISAKEPSLRYLLVNVTWLCNLRCEHCYVHQRREFMDFETFKKTVDDLYAVGGLKLMVSGGEPLLHPEIWRFLEYARMKPFRIVLLTNGLLIGEKEAERLKELVDEVQVSIDGIEGHERLRGVEFEAAMSAVKTLVKAGVDVSVSTMVTKYNLEEFEGLGRLLSDCGIIRWAVDYPTTLEDVVPDFDVAAEIMSKYGFGELGHEGSGNFACGAHFASVSPSGEVSKCGFFEDEAVGSVDEGLKTCWERLKERYIWTIDELQCECEFRQDCRGGCRYRALVYSGNLFGEDPVMCRIFGK
jgi:radical SAM protein with 4Fe4S-binding SPASM domain